MIMNKKTWNDGADFENHLMPEGAPAVATRNICSGGGKGGGAQQSSQPVESTSTVTQSNLPAYAQPYYENLMNQATAVQQTPYQAYTGQRIADFTAPQNQAFQTVQNSVGNYQPAFNQAQAGMTSAANTAGNVNFDPTMSQNTYSANNATTQNWNDPGVAQQYMSPYQQGVTDIATREALRQYGVQQTQANAGAQSAGAFGGDRAAILSAENARNMNTNLNDIQTQGLQSAYTAGQNQFNTQQGVNLAANQLNNQYGQAQSTLGMQAVNQNNAALLSQQQLNLQGGQLGLQAAQGLQGLGQAQQAASLSDANALSTIGAQQQQQAQTGLDTAYQDFLNQRSYPAQQLNWYSGILHGVPVSANSDVTGYTAQPSQTSQLAGLGLGAAGLSKLLG